MCLGQSPRDCAGFVIASNLTNAQCPIPNSHPRGKQTLQVRPFRIGIENLELSIGQIRGHAVSCLVTDSVGRSSFKLSTN